MIVTVDVWDTLIRRRCHPDAVKDAVSARLLLRHGEALRPSFRDAVSLTELRVKCEANIGAESRMRGLDDEYPIGEVFVRWLSESLRPEVVGNFDTQACVADLLEYEIKHEIRVTYKDPHIEREILRHGAKDIRVISDFYMPWPMLSRILEANGVLQYISQGYVSCDLGYNKRSGRLFDNIPDLVGRSDWVHIGDNEHSDVKMPGERGAKAIHFLPSDEHALREARNRTHRSPERAVAHLHDMLSALPCEGLARFGADFSPALAGFLLQVNETARRERADKIVFLTREGEFLRRAYGELFGDIIPPVAPESLLCVSRLSTFAASLKEPYLEDMGRFWSQYRESSPAVWFTSLGLDPDSRLHGLLAAHGLPFNTAVANPASNTRVRALFSDQIFNGILSSHVASRRAELLAYLVSVGWQNGPEIMVLVDVGWRGTIQDNLAWIFPEKRMVGCYFGLQPFLNPQPKNTAKSGYAVDLNENCGDSKLLEHVSPIEMLMNSESGSVTGYQVTPGGVRVLTAASQAGAMAYRDGTKPFQDGVIHGLRHLRQSLQGFGLAAADLRDEFKSRWRSLLAEPPEELCRTFVALHHDETFGAGEMVGKNPHIGWLESWLFPVVPGWSARVRRLINAVGWPAGYLRAPNANHALKRAIRIDRWLKPF